MTHKERMLAMARGEMPDRLPYAPRIDLWYQANQKRGTLPPEYQGLTADEIARKEGWALHKVILEYTAYGDDPILDRPLGIFRIPVQGFLTHLPAEVERKVERKGDLIEVQYYTPKGTARGAFVYTEEMRRMGISNPWIREHVLKGPGDYAAVGYIFENLKIQPMPEGYQRWADSIGEDGMPVVYALTGGSPMHHIMKVLLDATDFYYHHRDYPKEMEALAEKVGVYFRRVLETVARGPGEVVLVGANFDDMITYPPFFEAHILPWLQEAADLLHREGKLLLCHCDGENRGLLDLLLQSGMDIAEAVCPHPMTKVTLAEYYRRWSHRVTIYGGIPSNLLLSETATDEDFRDYIEEMLRVIVPGRRFIVGVADTTPPDARFERLRLAHELIRERGELPLREVRLGVPTAFEMPPAGPSRAEARMKVPGEGPSIPNFQEIQRALADGDEKAMEIFVRKSIEKGGDPAAILRDCLIPAMEGIGQRFKRNEIFIPEVLLSARAMNEAMRILEPFLVGSRAQSAGPLVVLGTVKGDLHDIGKNLVAIMLRSVGFRVEDLGVDIEAKKFIETVKNQRPFILGLSALLTTTLPEMKKVIEGLKEAGIREKVKVMVGGAPVSEHFARQIGADAYGADAGEAAEKAKALLGA
jgi:corrinoid protein of di/trimethylamine methyltransferase